MIGIGVGMADMASINDKMSSLGIDPFRNYGLSLDLESQTDFNRLMMGGELRGLIFMDRVSNNMRSSFSSGSLLLKSGYNVINTDHVQLYPYLGLGVGLLDLMVRDNEVPFDSALVRRHHSTVSMYQTKFLVDLGVAFDLLGGKNPKHLGVLGIRAGYSFDPYTSDRWHHDGEILTNSPTPALNGAYVMLTLGGAHKISGMWNSGNCDGKMCCHGSMQKDGTQ